MLSKEIKYAHLNLDIPKIDFTKLRNPLEKYRSVEQYMDILKIIRNPDNLYFTLKYIFNIEPTVFQLVWLKLLWKYPFPMVIATRGASKSYLYGLYCLWRALITQGSKIIIVSASFRQSKNVFEYAETILNSAPILKDLIGGNLRVLHGNDMWTMYVGDSSIRAIPLGNSGEKVRGLRATHILVDEVAAVPEEIYEVVIRGFGSVSSSPSENVMKMAKINLLKGKGLWTKENEKMFQSSERPNQIILAGTGDWGFKHFAKYWRRWKTIINSKGNLRVLQDAGIEIDEAFDYRDFCIIRMPIELIPEGFMDQKSVAQAKASMHISRYQTEMGSCVTENTEIVTDRGLKKIIDILPGDMVLTHKGRFREVEYKTFRHYNGNIIHFKAIGNNQVTSITPEHPCYNGNDSWISASGLDKYFTKSTLQELNNKQTITLADFTSNISHQFSNDVDYIYPSVMDKPLNLKRKKIIPNEIKLDYHFGIIMGYYISEGSTSLNAIEFSLDGHKNETLESYIEELKTAIQKTFHISTSIYFRKNLARVVILSTIIRDLIKTICPGVSETKTLDSSVLYSNSEFLKGYITGYWHGDGNVHFSKENKYVISAKCVNKPLLSQIQTALSYFNIRCSLNNGLSAGRRNFQDRTYDCQATYILTIRSDSHSSFLNLINNPENYQKGETKELQYKIISKETEKYNGYVYNLHVKEDNSYSLINSTVHNCFPDDSNGFFKRSLIESCVTKDPIHLPSGPVQFRARLIGDHKGKYIYGVDPASETDNFAIVIIEQHIDHNRIVYSWTTTREKIRKNRIAGMIAKDDNDFYQYVAKKIRALMKVFPTQLIAMDSQGGGYGVMEALHNLKALEPGELPIWPIVEDHPLFWKGGKSYGYDDEAGLHIIEMVEFVRTEYRIEANHTLRREMENKTLLFPIFDPIEFSIAQAEDERSDRNYDTLENVVAEIEELKEELSTIMHTTTQTGKDKWDTPEIILPGQKKGRLRKDRYSALLIASYAAFRCNKPTTIGERQFAGGIAQNLDLTKKSSQPLYSGPSWVTESVNNSQYFSSRSHSPNQLEYNARGF